MATTEQANELALHDETGFQRDLLTVIAKLGKTHGLGIKDELDRQYDGEIHHGRLYPNLDTLVDRGLVAKGTVDRRTNSYELTERGQREVNADLEWRQEALSDD